jgi:hypothetical protein
MVMGRCGALIDRHLRNLEHYLERRAAVAETAREVAEATGFANPEVYVNARHDERGPLALAYTHHLEIGTDLRMGRAKGLVGQPSLDPVDRPLKPA